MQKCFKSFMGLAQVSIKTSSSADLFWLEVQVEKENSFKDVPINPPKLCTKFQVSILGICWDVQIQVKPIFSQKSFRLWPP